MCRAPRSPYMVGIGAHSRLLPFTPIWYGIWVIECNMAIWQAGVISVELARFKRWFNSHSGGNLADINMV